MKKGQTIKFRFQNGKSGEPVVTCSITYLNDRQFNRDELNMKLYMSLAGWSLL